MLYKISMKHLKPYLKLVIIFKKMNLRKIKKNKDIFLQPSCQAFSTSMDLGLTQITLLLSSILLYLMHQLGLKVMLQLNSTQHFLAFRDGALKKMINQEFNIIDNLLVQNLLKLQLTQGTIITLDSTLLKIIISHCNISS